MMPLRLTKPTVGLIPTRLLAEAGERIELMVSVPTPINPKFAASPAPVPPEVVGVAGLAAERTDRLAPDGELVKVHLREDDRASLFQLCHDGGVIRRDVALEA